LKKALSSLLVILLIITLTGCTGKEAAKSNKLDTEHLGLEEKNGQMYSEPASDTELTESNIEDCNRTNEEVVSRNEVVRPALESEVEEAQKVEEKIIEVKPTYDELVLGDVIVGNTVKFGRYEQDNILDNGPEAIEWRVMSVEDGYATLIPGTALMCGGFEDVKILPQEMYSEGFTEDEKKLISEFHNVIDRDFLSKYAGRRTDYLYDEVYNQTSALTCLTSYSDYAAAVYYAEYTVRGYYQPDDSYQVRHKFLCGNDRVARWVDVTGGRYDPPQNVHVISMDPYDPDGWGAIYPYVVIKTSELYDK